jgi:hypothetical protein
LFHDISALNEIAILRIALEESLRLQSHYASMLNGYDGGDRMVFNFCSEWIDRLEKIGRIKNVNPKE